MSLNIEKNIHRENCVCLRIVCTKIQTKGSDQPKAYKEKLIKSDKKKCSIKGAVALRKA